MKRIKSYKRFIEAVSGTLAPVNGPGLPRMELRPTLSQSDTNVVFDEPSGKFYTEDEYDEIYREYLEKGGTPLMDGLNKENLEKVLNYKK
jgi:hypothetical protein